MWSPGKLSSFIVGNGCSTALRTPKVQNIWLFAFRPSQLKPCIVMSSHGRIRQVSVYCASSCQSDPIYFEAAHRLGQMLAGESITIIYGGGAAGSMVGLPTAHWRVAAG